MKVVDGHMDLLPHGPINNGGHDNDPMKHFRLYTKITKNDNDDGMLGL